MKFINIIYIIIVSTLVSCLPQEKTTQCGTNEAYDSARRKCVATLSTSTGTVNISNVTPSTSYTVSSVDASKTHSVTISDPYDNGYQVKWMVTYPNGNTTLAGTGLTLTFNHNAYSTGVYILEVQLLSSAGTEVYDSRSWTVNIIDQETPSISAVTPTPMTTTLTSSNTIITANASNPDAIANVQYEWYVNGSITASTGSFSTTSSTLNYSFDPDSYGAGPGVYNVQLILKEDGTGSTYTAFNWVITVAIPNFATISTGTSGSLSTATPAEGEIIEVISDMTISAGGFLYDVDSDDIKDPVDLCVNADNASGVNGDGVWVDFLIDGSVIPGASNQALSSATDHCLLDYNDYDYSLPSNIVAESHNITIKVYDKYTGNTTQSKYKGYNLIKDLTWTIRVRQQNTPPTVTINNSTTGALNKIMNCTKTDTTYTNCEVTQGTPFRIGITVEDDDYLPEDYSGDYANFRVDFMLNAISLDGSSNDISDTDCYEDFSETADATRYYCDVTINPYDSNGPIDVSGLSYTLSAIVTDQGSPYTTTTKQSNTVTWKISSVASINTDPTIESFAADDGAKTANSSYIADPIAPTTALDLDATGAVAEGDEIQFVVSVNDAERDDHIIEVKRCLNNDPGCGATDKDIATVVVNSSNDDQIKQTTINHTITEDAVKNAGENTVYFRILVTDTDGGTSPLAVVGLLVANNNPDPVFDPDTFTPDVNVTTHTAFAGFPMTFTTDIDASNDASVMDGTTPIFQWMYKRDTDPNWIKIEGATENNLVWIPDASIGYGNPAGELVNIKVCVGDDGYESGASGDSDKLPYLATDTTTDCATGAISQASGKEWHVTVFSNMMEGGAFNDNPSTNQSNGEIASWVDPSSTNPIVKYTAYATTQSKIIVEKIVTYDNGTIIDLKGSAETGSNELSSISFAASTETSYATYPVSNLSIDGDPTNGKLYIAYMTYFSGTDAVHIRRIDISGGKLGLTHDGKFAWDTEYETDLTNYIVPSTSYGMDPLTVSTDGEPILTFNSAAITAMNVQFNNINNDSITFTAGSDFCSPLSNCSTAAATAADFAAAINNYNGANGGGLQGLTAVDSSNSVTLSGLILDDYIQKDINATSLGKIMVHQTNGTWVLPFINHGLPTPDKHKISLYEGSLTSLLDENSTVTYDLGGTVPSQELANDRSANDRIIIATKAYGTGLITMYELNSSYSFVDTNTDLFNGETTLSNIKVAVSKEASDFNPSAFVMAINTDNRFAYARVDSSGGNFDFTTTNATIDIDNGFHLSSTAINNYDITAGPSEFQLLLAAVLDPNSGTDYKTYLFNISGSSASIDCSHNPTYPQDFDYCTPINHTGNPLDIVIDSQVALTEVLKDVSLSTGGATSGENTNHIIGISHHIDGGSSRMLPIMGILNVSGATTSTLTTPNGNAGDATDPGHGVYMNPYVSN